MCKDNKCVQCAQETVLHEEECLYWTPESKKCERRCDLCDAYFPEKCITCSKGWKSATKNKCVKIDSGGRGEGSRGEGGKGEKGDETYKGCPANCYECYTKTRECVECGHGHLLNEKSICEM